MTVCSLMVVMLISAAKKKVVTKAAFGKCLLDGMELPARRLLLWHILLSSASSFLRYDPPLAEPDPLLANRSWIAVSSRETKLHLRVSTACLVSAEPEACSRLAEVEHFRRSETYLKLKVWSYLKCIWNATV